MNGYWNLSKFAGLSILFLLLISSYSFGLYNVSSASQLTSSFLSLNQSSNGQWNPNPYYQFYTTIPTTSMAINGHYSNNVTLATNWLAANVYNLNYFPEWDNSSGYGGQSIGEDLGAVLLALGSANYSNTTLIDNVSAGILAYQNSTGGGIIGYSDPTNNYASISDSADTAWALIGMHATNFTSPNQTQMLDYLESLQNSDGSINLTVHELGDNSEGGSLDSVSTTALSAIAFQEYGLGNSVYYNKAMQYLQNNVLTCYSNSSFSYSAAIATWALDKSNLTTLAYFSQLYLASLSNPNGTYADSRRSSTNKPYNSIDTGAALLGLEYQNPLGSTGSYLPCDNLTINNASLVNSTNLCSLTWQLQVNVTGPQSAVYANLTGPSSYNQSYLLSLNTSTGLFESPSFSLNSSGNYSLAVAVTQLNGNNLTQIFTQNVANPVLIGVVNLFANGTQTNVCAQVPVGISSECALQGLPFNTTWQQYSFGDSLASVSGQGCSASDAFCQCNNNNNACCLYWNLLLLNTSNQWETAQAGWSDILVSNNLVFANVWGNSGRQPNDTSFSTLCGSASANNSLNIYQINQTANQTNNFDALTCNSCTQNSQCNTASGTSQYCVHGICRSTPTYCGDGYCDNGETCNSCSADCGVCPSSNNNNGGGASSGGFVVISSTPVQNTTTTTLYTPPNIYPQIHSPNNTIQITTTLVAPPTLQPGEYTYLMNSINSVSKQLAVDQQYSTISSSQLYTANSYLNSARNYLSQNNYTQTEFYLSLAQSLLASTNPANSANSSSSSSSASAPSNSSGLFFGISDNLATFVFVIILAIIAIGGYYFGRS